MPDLKAEYASMTRTAGALRHGTAGLPRAVARFQQSGAQIAAFGHIPGADRAKRTVHTAMAELARATDDLLANWEAQAVALRTVADVLRELDGLLARRSGGG